jgi:hypothetical protein
MSYLIVFPTSAAQASPQPDAVPNPEIEAYILSELQANGYVDLEGLSEEERVISGDFLVKVLKDPQVQNQSFIYLGNLTVTGEVLGNDIIFPGNLQFERVEFTDYVDFNSSLLHAVWIGESTFASPVIFGLATFDGIVVINNSLFTDAVDFGFATFGGSVILSENTFEELSFGQSTVDGNMDLRDNTFNRGVNFDRTHVTGELLLDGSQLLGTEPFPGNSFPIEFKATTVDRLASFVNTRFAGEANFEQSEFYRLDMEGVVFEQNVDFKGMTVERSADFTNASFGQKANFTSFAISNTGIFQGATFHGDAIFENATIGRDFGFYDATFNGPANFDYITVGRFCDFIRTTFNDEFSFYYTSVAWPYFDEVTFNGRVDFEGMQVSEDFEVANTSYNYAEEAFDVTVVTVDGAVTFKNFSAPAGLRLSRSHFESLSIETEEKLETEFIDISETDIANELTIGNIHTKKLSAEGTSVGKSTNLNRVSITQELNMRNASIGFLKIDQQPQWPSDPKKFNLLGMNYTDIDIGKQGLTEETLQSLLGLVNQSAYSPQSYEALVQFLTDKGHPDWAAEVELAQKRRERNEILTRFSGAWFWSWFLDIFAGYGQRPVFAFGWSALVIAIGAFVFRRKEDMSPVGQEAPVEYNPIWYSFSLFLPYIDLGIASKWEPCVERKWARNYKYIHMMLGWILAPIALLTFGGIIG